jgi:hypothetical protein
MFSRDEWGEGSMVTFEQRAPQSTVPRDTGQRTPAVDVDAVVKWFSSRLGGPAPAEPGHQTEGER